MASKVAEPEIPISLIMEFVTKIVDPYFNGDSIKALTSLLDKAVIEEELFQAHIDKRRVIFEKR